MGEATSPSGQKSFSRVCRGVGDRRGHRAIIALIDADDRHHRSLRKLYEMKPDEWILPCAILPEVDYLLGAHVGRRAEEAFVADLAAGAFAVEWGDERDLAEANRICRRHKLFRSDWSTQSS